MLVQVLSSYMFARLDSLYQKHRPDVEVQHGVLFARRQGPQLQQQAGLSLLRMQQQMTTAWTVVQA